jgi:hypothetical protein
MQEAFKTQAENGPPPTAPIRAVQAPPLPSESQRQHEEPPQSEPAFENNQPVPSQDPSARTGEQAQTPAPDEQTCAEKTNQKCPSILDDGVPANSQQTEPLQSQTESQRTDLIRTESQLTQTLEEEESQRMELLDNGEPASATQPLSGQHQTQIADGETLQAPDEQTWAEETHKVCPPMSDDDVPADSQQTKLFSQQPQTETQIMELLGTQSLEDEDLGTQPIA